MFRNFLASFCGFLLVLVLVPAMYLFAVFGTYLSEGFYGKEFADKAYDRVVDVVVVAAMEQPDGFRRYFTENELREEVTSVFDVVFFREFVRDWSRGALEIIRDTSGEGEVRLSTEAVRERLPKIIGALADRRYRGLEKCSNFELKEFAGKDGLPDCKSPYISEERYRANIELVAERDVVSEIPPEVVVSLEEFERARGNVSYDAFVWLRWVHIAMVALLLMVIVLLTRKKFLKTLSVVGKAGIVSGGLGMLSVFGIMKFPEFLREMAASGDAPAVGTEMVEIVFFVLGFLGDRVRIYSWVFLVVGILMYSAAVTLKRKGFGTEEDHSAI